MAIDTKELEIVLAADTSGFKRKMPEAAKEARNFGAAIDDAGRKASDAGNKIDDAGKKVEKTTKKVDDSTKTAEKFGKQLGVVAVAAAAGITALVSHSIKAADNLYVLSQRMGTTTEFLSTMGYAARTNGASFAELTTGLENFSVVATKAASGSRTQAAAFRALGIDAGDAVRGVKPLQQLVPEVATAFARYADGPEKAALANKLFGEGGEKLIPMLNELGREGFDKVREAAERMGLVIDGQTAKAANDFGNQMEVLKMVTLGWANDVAKDVLPNLVLFTRGLADNAVKAREGADKTTSLGNAIRGTFGFFVTIGALAEKAGVLIGYFAERVSIGFEKIKLYLNGDYLKAFASALAGDTGAFQAVLAYQQRVEAKFAQRVNLAKQNLREMTDEIDERAVASIGRLNQKVETLGETATETGKKLPKVPLGDWAAGANKAADDTDKFADAYAKSQTRITLATAELAAKLEGPYTQAMNGYASAEQKATAIANAHVKAGTDAGHAAEAEAEAQAYLKVALAASNQTRAETIQQLDEQADVVGNFMRELAEDQSLVGLTDRELAVAQAVQKVTDAYASLSQEQRDRHPLTEEMIQDAGRAAGAAYDHAKAVEFWRDTWTQAIDQVSGLIGEFAIGNIKSFSDFGKQLWDIAKQTVSRIIAEFARLAIIKLFTGQGGSWGQLAGSAFTSLGGSSGSGGGSITGSLGNSAGNWISNLFGGGGSAAGYAGLAGAGAAPLAAGSYAAGGAAPWITGASSTAPWTTGVSSGVTGIGGGSGALTAGTGGAAPYGGTIGGYSTLGIGGALAGALYGYGRGDGGLGTAGSTAAGAIGGYAIGTAVATGAGAVAGGATLAAGASAGLAAIPVVGWIALAALAIDAISGGKLFGTKFQTKSSTETTSISDSDANVTAVLHQERQAALFGGIRRRDKTVDPGAEAQAGADSLRQALKDQMAADAAAVEAEVIPIVSGIFETITEYTKKGKVKSSKTISEVLGKTYEEDSDAFVARLAAENRIALADAIGAGGLATQIAEEYRGSAETLSNAAAFLLNAQFDLNKGQSLLTTQAGDTLEDVTRVVRDLAQQGETLIDTYARLQQAAAQYRQFIAQFDEPITVASEFQANLYGVYQAMQQNIASANALAQAAGLAGAREEDLVKIHKYAARQVAALVDQLRASAFNAAAALGYVDTLDTINARIDELQGRADSFAGSTHSVADATERMRRQVSLLLGDLSPFNDRQKLEIARQGLNQGTVSQEEFLEIARRLFGATSRYVQEFNYAQAHPGRTDQTPGGSSGAQPLSSAEQAELADLIARRDAAEEAQRQQAARALAQQIADISSATGQTFEEVAAGIGFNLDQLGADLKLQSNELLDYLTSLQEGNLGGLFEDGLNGVSSAIYEIGSAIVSAITGTDTVLGDARDLQKPAQLEPAGPADQFPPSQPDTGNEGPNTPPAPGDANNKAQELQASSSPAQAETNVRLESMEKKLAEVLDRIATNTERTATNSDTIATETAATAQETGRLRRDLGGLGGGRAPRSDRGREYVR